MPEFPPCKTAQTSKVSASFKILKSSGNLRYDSPTIRNGSTHGPLRKTVLLHLLIGSPFSVFHSMYIERSTGESSHDSLPNWRAKELEDVGVSIHACFKKRLNTGAGRA